MKKNSYTLSLLLFSLCCINSLSEIVRREKNIHNIPSTNPNGPPMLTNINQIAHEYDEQQNILHLPLHFTHSRKNNLAKLKENILTKEVSQEVSLLKQSSQASPHYKKTSQNLQQSLLDFRNLDSQFIITVAFGSPSQYVDCIMDTGSATLWAVSSDCKSATCKLGQQFNRHLSYTFNKQKYGHQVSVKFASAQIKGRIGMDVVSLGPYSVENQTFGLIEEQQGSCFKSVSGVFITLDLFQGNFSCIMGLGFPKLTDNGTSCIFDKLMQQYKLKRNVFSFWVPNNQGPSQLGIGGIDKSKYVGKMECYPVKEEYYWGVEIQQVRYNNIRIDNCSKATPCIAVLDTGTTVITLPSEAKFKFDRKFKLLVYEPLTIGLATQEACKNRQIGNLDFFFGNGDKYSFKSHEFFDTEIDCVPLLSKVDIHRKVGDVYLIGAPIFLKYYIAFDRDNKCVGIAQYRR